MRTQHTVPHLAHSHPQSRSPRQERRTRLGLLGSLVVAVLILAPGLATSALAQGATTTAAPLGIVTTVERISERPLQYAGRLVTVVSTITDDLGPVGQVVAPHRYAAALGVEPAFVGGQPSALRVLTLAGDDILDDEELVVLVPNASLTALAAAAPLGFFRGLETRELEVTGIVLPAGFTTFERDLGLALNDAVIAGRPVLVAQRIDLTTLERAEVEPAGLILPGVLVDEILDEPARFYGRPVEVIAEVGEIYGPYAFTVEDSDYFFDDELLVVSRAGRAFAEVGLYQERAVQISGVIAPFDPLTLRGQVGDEFDSEMLDAFAGQPVLIAEEVEIPLLGPVPLAPVRAGERVDEILDEPARFLGQPVVLATSVGEVLGPRAFTLEGSDFFFDEELLVVLAMDEVFLESEAIEDRVVQVSGTVWPFVRANFERQFGLALDPGMYGAFEGRPVVVAEHLDLSAYAAAAR